MAPRSADIVISEFMDAEAVESLRADFEVLHDPALVDRVDDLHAALTAARALIVRNRTRVDVTLLDAAPRLRVVGRLGVGLDNIDVAGCTGRGIAVCPATGANAIAVAEYVLASTLLLLRGAAYQGTSQVLAGDWPRNTFIGHDAHGRTMGLLGLGAIARAVAARAAAMGMSVIAHDPYLPAEHEAWQAVEPISFEDLVARADVLSLHVPLTDGTRNLIDAARLATMKSDALLINTARGGIVDEHALATALSRGNLGGAALDVFAEEPLTKAGARHLQDVPNLVLTPHIAGVTHESNILVSAVTAENVRRALAGAVG